MKYTASITPAKYLLPQEEAALLGVLERYRAKDLVGTTMLLFMLKTGVRPQECINLTWGDINSGDGSVHVRTLKGGPERVIPIGRNLIKRLQAMGRGADEEQVFKMDKMAQWRIWDSYRPVPKKLHALRHTCAVNAHKNVKDVKIVQMLMGHANLQTTDIYLQVVASVSQLRKAVGE